MNRSGRMLVAAVLTSTMAGAPWLSVARADEDVTRREVANFDAFLDGHPRIAKELRECPSRANDDEYLDRHPELIAFLKEHARVREELQEHPAAFMRQEHRFEGHERTPDEGRNAPGVPAGMHHGKR
jgi:hypothetical protein